MENYSDSLSDCTLSADDEMATQRSSPKKTLIFGYSNELDTKITSTRSITFESKSAVSNFDAEMATQQIHSQLTPTKTERKRVPKSKRSKTSTATFARDPAIQSSEPAKLPVFEDDTINSEHHFEHKKIQFENSNPYHIRFESPESIIPEIEAAISKRVGNSPSKGLNISFEKTSKTRSLTTHPHFIKSPSPETAQPSWKTTTGNAIKSSPPKHKIIDIEGWVDNDISASKTEDMIICGSSHTNLKPPGLGKTKLSSQVTMNKKLRSAFLPDSSTANDGTADESEVEETITSASAQAALSFHKQVSTRSASMNKVSQKSPRININTRSRSETDQNATNFDSSGEPSSSYSSSTSSDEELFSKVLHESGRANFCTQPVGINSFNESNSSHKESFSYDTKNRTRKTLKKGSRAQIDEALAKSNTTHESTLSFDSSLDDKEPPRKRFRQENQISRPSVTSLLPELPRASPSRVCPQKMKWLKENVMRAQINDVYVLKKNNDTTGDDENSNKESIDEEPTGTSGSDPLSSSSNKSDSIHTERLQIKQTTSALTTVALGSDRVSPQKLKWLKKNVMMAQADDYIKQEESEEPNYSDDPESYDEMSDEDYTSEESGSSHDHPIPLTRPMLRPRTQPYQPPLLISPYLQPQRQRQRQPEPEKRHPTQPGFPPLSQLPASLPAHIKEIYTRERHGGQLTYKELNTLTHHLTLLQLRLRRRSKSYLRSGRSAFLIRKILRNKKHLTAGLRAHREKQYEHWRKRAGRKWKKLEEVRGVIKVLERTIEVEWGREGMMWQSKK